MRRLRHLLVAGAAVLAGTAVDATPVMATGSHRVLATRLSGAVEVPGPGDPDGSGVAALVISSTNRGGRVCYALAVKNIMPATAAHIHVGGPTVAGPIVVGLAPPTDGFSARCMGVDRTVAQAIIDMPANYYVNVHTDDFPMGAIRGQLG